MANREEFDFDTDDLKEPLDAYDYSDLIDLSTLPPTQKAKKSEEELREEALQDRVAKAFTLLNIVTVIVVCVLIAGIIIKVVFPAFGNGYVKAYNAGVEAYDAGNYEEAIEYFEQALEYEDADNVNERFYLYKAYKTLGDESNAIQVLLDLLEYDSTVTDAIQVVANYYYSNGMTEELNAFLEKYSDVEGVSLDGYSLSAPSVSYDSGEYVGDIDIVLYDADGRDIYYTLDGTDPTDKSDLFNTESPIHLTEGTWELKACVITVDGVSGPMIDYTYTITVPELGTPEVSPESGKYTKSQEITVDNTNDYYYCYYTTDGSDPTDTSYVYMEPIEMPMGTTMFAFAFIDSDGNVGNIVYREYTRE